MELRTTSLGWSRQNIKQTLMLLDSNSHVVTGQILHDLLKECTKYKDLSSGKRLSSYIMSRKLDVEVFLHDCLIRMFAACGELQDAWNVFSQVSKPSIFTWNAIISAHSSLGKSAKALQLYQEMKMKGLQPDAVTFLSTLKACCDMKIACQGMIIHNDIIVSGWHLKSTVGNAVLDLYCKCGNLQEAKRVFDTLEIRTVVSWGALMAGYAQHGHGVQALKLLERMQGENIEPNLIIFSSALQACNHAGHLVEGRFIHDSLVKSGLQTDIIIQNTLVDMYAKCGSNNEAHTVFLGMVNRDVASWGSLIAGYAVHGPTSVAFELFHEMQHNGFQPCKATYLIMLKACATGEVIDKGRMVHDQIIKSRYENDSAVGNTIIDMYAKCASLEEARRVFDRLRDCNVVSWGAMIAGYAAHGLGAVAIWLFQQMHCKGISASNSIMTSILKACADENDARQGRLVHFVITDLGVEEEPIENMLLDMYVRCGNLEDAQNLLKLFKKSVDLWASVLTHCSECRYFDDAFNMFDMMQKHKAKMSNTIYSSILKVCTNAHDMHKGRLIHEDIIRNRFDRDIIVGNKLVDMYAKIGPIEESYKIFSLLPYRDDVSWGAMITGYVEHGLNFAALELYEKSQHESVEPTEATLLSLLKACGSVGALHQGRLLHDRAIRNATQKGMALCSTLLDMYAKCGSLCEAHTIFDRLPHQDAIAWGALIAGYTWNGSTDSALQALKLMQLQRLKPDEVIVTNALAACSHTGLLKEGHFHFMSLIEKYRMVPGMEQISCLIDLLGRSGNVREAEDMHLAAPAFSDEVAQLSILTSCRTYQSTWKESLCFMEAT